MKILVTCFDAFGGEAINASHEAVALLPDRIGDKEIVKCTLPTVFGESLDRVREVMEQEQPDVVLAIGQAGGRAALSVERLAINWMDAKKADNAENLPKDAPIVDDGPHALTATVPVKKMVEAIQAEGVPAEISYSAGAFVCNQLLYGILYEQQMDASGPIGGFIHIPYLPEQVQEKPGVASLSLEEAVRGLRAAIACLTEADKKDYGVRLVDGWHIPEAEADEYIRTRERYAEMALAFYAKRFASVRRDFAGSQDGEAVLGLDEQGELQFLLHLDPMNIQQMEEAEEKGQLEDFFLEME